MLRYFFMLACLCIFTACERASELTKSPDPSGDFFGLFRCFDLASSCRPDVAPYFK